MKREEGEAVVSVPPPVTSVPASNVACPPGCDQWPPKKAHPGSERVSAGLADGLRLGPWVRR